MKSKHITNLVVSSLIFVVSCCYLVATVTEQGSLASRLYNSATLVPLTREFKRNGDPSGCAGTWDCLEQICTMQLDNIYGYVAVSDASIWIHNTTKCGWSMRHAFEWAFQFSAMKACIAFLVMAVFIELVGLIATLCRVRSWIMIVVLLSSVAFNITAWICYYVYIAIFNNSYGAPAPNYIQSWQLVTTVYIWVALLISRVNAVYRISLSTNYTKM